MWQQEDGSHDPSRAFVDRHQLRHTPLRDARGICTRTMNTKHLMWQRQVHDDTRPRVWSKHYFCSAQESGGFTFYSLLHFQTKF